LIAAAFALFCFLAISPAVNAATTFPKNEAGIAAYVKLAPLSQTNFDNARRLLFDSASASSTYMIGIESYNAAEQNQTYKDSIDFHIYLGTNGWLVAYLLKDETPSKIVNWNAGQPLSNTMLKAVIEDAIQKIGATASSSIQYYDFFHPEANKMTLVRENLTAETASTTNDFNVTVPGTLYQASWAINCDEAIGSSYADATTVLLDNSTAGYSAAKPIVYGNYDLRSFIANIDHKITLKRRSDSNYKTSAATLLIYKTN
jgi:hypothetical protein